MNIESMRSEASAQQAFSSGPEHIRGRYARLIAIADVSKHRRDSRVRQASTKLPGQSLCPCGSGRKFKNCCRNRYPPRAQASAASQALSSQSRPQS